MFFDINPSLIDYINYYEEDEQGDCHLITDENLIDVYANSADVYLKDGRVCEVSGSFFVSLIKDKFMAYQYEKLLTDKEFLYA